MERYRGIGDDRPAQASLFAMTNFLVFSELVRSQTPLPLRPDRASSADLRVCMVVQVVASTAIGSRGHQPRPDRGSSLRQS